jgi:uncharacterized protein
VILVDANLLIYAYNVVADEHRAARDWLERVLLGDEEIALPWAVIHAFMRLTTGGVVLHGATSIDEAMRVVDEWRSLPHVRVIEPGPRYWEILRQLCIESGVRGKLVSDAHLAALAIEHDATLYTADGDFRRFAGLRVINPLRA